MKNIELKNVNQKNLKDIDFKKGLLPAIVQDHLSNEVLMLAYMSEESLKRTLETGTTWFWSRSREEFWNKGATSGHFQYVRSISVDCDGDTLLIRVKQIGAACHTGNKTCFYRKITSVE
jgi:phosphoribosyl-AMP cyclohydrolase